MAPSSLWLELLVAKVAVSAGIVIGVTAAAERLGTRMGAMIAATPQLAVLSLVFFSIEQGREFAAESAFWNIPGVCATVPLYLAYIAATGAVREPRVASVAAGALAGAAAFVCSALVLAALPLARATVMPFAAAVSLSSAWLVRRLPDSTRLTRVRTSAALLAVRAGVSAAMVLGVTSGAHLLGPKWAGLVTGFPVNSLPVMAILHFHYGVDAIKPLVKLWPVGMLGICLFNLTAWLVTPRLGVAAAIALGYALDIAYLSAVDWLRRRLG
jgi:hypothetical protein